MNKKAAEELFDKYVSGQCSEEEKLLFETLYAKIAGLEKSGLDAGELEVIRGKIYARLPQGTKQVKVIRLWPRIAVAAAAVAAITLGIWLYYASSINGHHPDAGQDPAVAMNDIAPGKNTATLTLANGKTIVLSDAKTGVVIGDDKLAYNDGVEIPDQVWHDGAQTLIASTPRGGTYQVTLPDGTHVWLNADSKISFPSQFTGKERKILLFGEAYFEVAKDKKHPFIVEGGGQQVKVLGTHFNISNYPDEGSVKTTLLEGSVEVSTPAPRAIPGIQQVTGMRFALVPGQQATYNGQKITIKEVDASDIVDWKNGEFIFKSEDIKSIMNRVAKWYDIEVVYSGPIPTEGFNGIVSRNKNISQVLKMLEQTNAVHFKIEGKRVYVSK